MQSRKETRLERCLPNAARMHLFRQPLVLFVFAFVLFSIASDVEAASLTLEWDPPVDGTTVGYIVLYGTAAGVYSARVDVGAVTTYRIDGLADATQYFFSVQAYNASGEVGAPATEVSGLTAASGGGPTAGPTSTPGTETSSTEAATSGGTEAPGISESGASTTLPVDPTITQLEVVMTERGRGRINVSWVAASGTHLGYRVEVGAAPGETLYSAFTTEAGIEFETTSLPPGVYFLRARVLTASGAGPASGEVTLTSPADPVERLRQLNESGACSVPPRAPRQLGAAAHGSAVRLLWQPGDGKPPKGYVLQVGSARGRWDLSTVALDASTEVNAAARDGVYALRLAAVDNCGTSVWGVETEVEVSTVAALPGTPRQLRNELDADVLTLSWKPPARGDVTRYLLELTTPFGPVTYELDSSLTFTSRNTPPGRYEVAVRAGNATGFGPRSAVMTVLVP